MINKEKEKMDFSLTLLIIIYYDQFVDASIGKFFILMKLLNVNVY